MSLPTKEEIEALDFAGPSGPRVRVAATRTVDTGSLDYSPAGGPVAANTPTTPITNFPCGSEPHTEITTYMRSDGASGSKFYTLQGALPVETVFPAAGGTSDFSLRFWLRRPNIPTMPSGVVTQIKNGLSRLTVSIADDQTLGVAVTDGTTTVSRTITSPLIGFEWSSLTLVHDALSGILSVSAGAATTPGAIGLYMDLSGLTHAPATDPSVTLLAEADGSQPIDADVIGWGLYGYKLPAEQPAGLDVQGKKYDPRNNGASPKYFYREVAQDGAVPNAGCGGGAEVVLAPIGGAKSKTNFEEKKGGTFMVSDAVAQPDYSDEGGYKINLSRTVGNWPIRGPYRVQLLGGTDAKVYPLGYEGCFACEPGLFMDCYTDTARQRIHFALPSLPSQNYGVRVSMGEGVVVASAAYLLRVVPRNRAWPESYSLAENLGAYGRVAGVLDVRAEPEATDANRPPFVPWEALAKAFGRGMREVSGTPTTRLRGDQALAVTILAVESVLAFPESGWLWIDAQHLQYTARSVDNRTLTLALPLVDGLPGNTPVVLDTKVQAHPGLYAEPVPVAI